MELLGGGYGACKVRSGQIYGGVGAKIAWDAEEHGGVDGGKAEFVADEIVSRAFSSARA